MVRDRVIGTGIADGPSYMAAPSYSALALADPNRSLLHTTRSNIFSSAAGASDSNSRHTAPPILTFNTDIDIGTKSGHRYG